MIHQFIIIEVVQFEKTSNSWTFYFMDFYAMDLIKNDDITIALGQFPRWQTE
jgi:hypothetical protein